MNPMDLFKNMQEMQGKLQEAQEKVQKIRAVGSSGGDMVQIELTGDFRIISVTIAPEIIDPSDRNMLQDLIRAAYNDASSKIREKLQGNISEMAGGLNLPPGIFG